MRGFRRVRGGFAAAGEDYELALVARLMADVMIILGEDPDDLADEDDPLAALERELGGALLPSDDPALALLLRDMSEDPDEADEMRHLAEGGVRQVKISNLTTVYRRLDGASGEFVVPESEVSAWLSAFNDLRLVLAARLDITDSAKAEEITERATRLAENDAPDETLSEEQEMENQLCLMYAMMSWWQDSLLDALRFSMPRG